jgi:hypothetical protein
MTEYLTSETYETPESVFLLYAPWLTPINRTLTVYLTREAAQERLDQLESSLPGSEIFKEAEIVEYFASPFVQSAAKSFSSQVSEDGEDDYTPEELLAMEEK